MNDLNTQQVILLALLVAFVTSIATGITVVSLMQQSTQPVTQTINRVVEKTVERIVEEDDDDPATPPVERVVETVVVNQEDLTVEAVSKNIGSVVRIYRDGPDNQDPFLGMGIIISSNGRILTDASVPAVVGALIAKVGGETYLLREETAGNGFATLQIADAPEGKTFTPVSIADSSKLQLAQSVIMLSGVSQNIVGTGIINNLRQSAEGNNTEIITSVNPSDIITGSVLVNLQGAVVGIRADGSLTTQTSFTPSNTISSYLQSISASGN